MSNIKSNIILLVIFFAVLGAFLFGGTKPTQEEKDQVKMCQHEAVSGNFGVTYHPPGVYTYHQDSRTELSYLNFMIKCLPENYSGRKEMKLRKMQLEDEMAIATKK